MEEQPSNRKPTAGERLGSMIVDHFIMTFAAMIFFIPGLISTLIKGLEVNHEPANFDMFGGVSHVGLIGLAVYLCKDCIGGRSLAKRAFKLQVVENSSGEVASPLRTLARNIFMAIWPLEVIVTLFNPSRRIGDMVAGTKVVAFDPVRKQPRPNVPQLVLSFALAYSALLLLMLPLEALKARMKDHVVVYVDSSINETAARETEQMFADSLGGYLTPDVRVYDRIQEANNLRYVSTILRLRENFLDSEEHYEEIKSRALSVLLSKFPEGTFVGQIKFVFEEPGSMQMRVLPLDWRDRE